MARRDVKVIQPGLVYVIEWASGWDSSVPVPEASSSSSSLATPDYTETDEWSRRLPRRERKKEKVLKQPLPLSPEDDSSVDDPRIGPIYVA